MEKYIIHPQYALKHPVLLRTIGDRVVNLKGKPITKKMAATRKTAPYDIIIPAATQEDMALIYAEQAVNAKNARVVIKESELGMPTIQMPAVPAPKTSKAVKAK